MDTWKIESNPAKQTVLTWSIVAVGLILTFGFRDFDASGFTNSLAGFLLGILLLVIGVPGILMLGKQTITVDPTVSQIIVEDLSRFGAKKRIIQFSEITDLCVSSLGNRSDGSVSYYVTFKLTSGKDYPLFFPSYYDGRWDESVAESRCRRLEEYLRGHSGLITHAQMSANEENKT
ncbi:MAG: hypothetical protein NTU47_10825 [Ignavibacteriales bacterium]|nr:hypothetical protein [Ignavibacteriales bacterium]